MADPIRTCAITRARRPRDELVRLVASPDGRIVVDYHGRLPGRGVWITPTREVLDLLPRHRGAVEKSLRATLDPADVEQQLRGAVIRALEDGLSMAAAAGVLVVGQDRLSRVLARDGVRLVAVAQDASPRTVEALQGISADATFVTLPLSADRLGARIGRSVAAVVGVGSGRPARHLRRQLHRLSALG